MRILNFKMNDLTSYKIMTDRPTKNLGVQLRKKPRFDYDQVVIEITK